MVGGCGVVCKGPGCEADWAAARIAIHRGATLDDGERDAWASAEGSYEGRVDEGSTWSVDARGERLFFGQPDADRVILVADRPGDGWIPPSSEWTDDEAGSRFGAGVVVDDVDGDGRFDLWVTAPERDDARGAALLFLDAESGGATAAAAALRVVGASPGDHVGDRIVRCGDLTGDDRPELLVTAPWYAPTTTLPQVPDLAGAVFLLRSEEVVTRTGVVQAWDLGAAWWGETPGEGAGLAVRCDTDHTGDGWPDIVVGAPWYDDLSGRVYILDGRPLPPTGGLAEVATRILAPQTSGEWFGAAVVAADLDGVPPAELAVGAPGFEAGRGRVHLYDGADVLALSAPKQVTVIGPESSRTEPDHLGRWLGVGDFDGDGLDDVVVGAPDYREGANFDVGRAWVFRGSGAVRWPLALEVGEADVALTGSQPFQRVGRAPFAADLDADGRDELVLSTRTDGR